jgi:hypothetical protein
MRLFASILKVHLLGVFEMKAHLKFSLAAAVFASMSTLASASIIWDESVDGDLSGDRLNPTTLNLGLGANNVLGAMAAGDLEYVHIHLQPGQSLTGLYLRGYESVDQLAFMGLQAGTTFTEDANAPNPANMLGWVLFGPSELNQDLLPMLGNQVGTIGFTPPLTGSDYTFWIQQTGQDTTYEFEFQTVPEPATLAALGLGAAALLRRRRRA